jgi:hypothetical protein
VDTLAPSHLPVSSKAAGAAAAAAETKKRRHYADIPNAYIFCPFAVETMGTFGEEALSLVKDLGKRLQEITGEKRSTAFLTQRISVAIQRGNAASILATIPTSAPFHEIFHL